MHRRWELIEALGQGAFGSVHLAKNLDNEKLFAVKRMVLETQDSVVAAKQYQAEVNILSALKHRYIVQYLGHSIDEEGHEMFLYLEYVGGGSLRALLTYLEGPMSPSLLKKSIGQIVSGLRYLHEHCVLHRHLKPANVLVTLDGDLKLADFGTTKDLGELTHSTTEQSPRGTAYIAPEISLVEIQQTQFYPELLAGSAALPAAHGKHTTASDIFSLGVMAFEMSTGTQPFQHEQQRWLKEQTQGKQIIEWPADAAVSAVIRGLVTKCLASDPTDRPSAEELQNMRLWHSPSRRNVKDYLEAMLEETMMS